MLFYHNTRCATSRGALQLLHDKGVEPEIVEYMKNPLTPNQLSEIINKLGISPLELVRTKESVWKEEFADKELSPEEIVLAMIEYPQLMERPILIKGDKGVVGRPKEKVLELV